MKLKLHENKTVGRETLEIVRLSYDDEIYHNEINQTIKSPSGKIILFKDKEIENILNYAKGLNSCDDMN